MVQVFDDRCRFKTNNTNLVDEMRLNKMEITKIHNRVWILISFHSFGLNR